MIIDAHTCNKKLHIEKSFRLFIFCKLLQYRHTTLNSLNPPPPLPPRAVMHYACTMYKPDTDDIFFEALVAS